MLATGGKTKKNTSRIYRQLKSIEIGGRAFAGDRVICTWNEKLLQHNLQIWNDTLLKHGIRINCKKVTLVGKSDSNIKIQVINTETQQVQNFKYLGIKSSCKRRRTIDKH